MIRPGFHAAETDEEKLAVYRLCYDVYVEEMGRYRRTADHERRVLIEPEDATARIFYGAPDGEIVATSRLSWGGDAPFSARQIEAYQLAPFLVEVTAEAIVAGERGMVRRHLRGSDIFAQLQGASRRFIQDKRIQLIDARIPPCVERLINQAGVLSQRVSDADAYWGEVQRAIGALAENRPSALDGMSEAEAARCLGHSNVIECAAGDRVLKKGGVARSMFIVLAGTLEVRDGDQVLRVMSPGDVFGEIAFLLGQPRSADVYAATDGVRVLSLSEGTIHKLIESDPNVAARLLLNISKILCLRLLQGA